MLLDSFFNNIPNPNVVSIVSKNFAMTIALVRFHGVKVPMEVWHIYIRVLIRGLASAFKLRSGYAAMLFKKPQGYVKL